MGQNKERPQTASDDEKGQDKVMLTKHGERQTGLLTGCLTTALNNGCLAAQMMIGGTR